MTAAVFATLLALAPGGQEITLAPPELTIPVGTTREVEFGTVPQQDTTVLLTITSRLQAPGLAGSMLYLGLKLNGQTVQAARARGLVRLLNRPVVSPVAPDVPAAWYDHGAWRVLYAPDFEAGKRQTFYTGDPYTLVLDVTDLTNPAAENRLEITNLATAGLAQRLGASLELVVGSLTVTTRPEASPLMTPATTVEHRLNHGEPAPGPAAYTARLLPGGAIALTTGGRSFTLASRFSFPSAGFNQLAAEPDTTGQPGWRPALRGDAELDAAGPDYSLHRTVTFGPRRIEVVDRLTNAHADRPVGLIVEHSLPVGTGAEAAVRLAGNPDPALDDVYAPANPSVHVGLGELGLGLVAEDDVFRNQARLQYDGETRSCRLRTEMLRLAPGESYDLRWSLYPVDSPEYYDFINLVRAEWGSNVTVEGAWTFFSPDQILALPVDELRARLERSNLNYACHWGGWVDHLADKKRIGFGAEVASDYWADYRDRLRRATARLHEARPGMKVLIYYDTQRDTHADAAAVYPDSLVTGSDGRQLSTEWSGQYSLTCSMVATKGNSFGRATLDLIDVYMDQIGADGLYWDEMELTGYGRPELTYSLPDGHTCLLNSRTHEIEREVGLTVLLGEGHRLAVIDKVRAKGGTLMGNGPCMTRAMLTRGVQRMVEIQHNDTWCYQGNLETPLGYASSRKDFGNVTRALGFATLLVGTQTDYPHEISRYLYPLTPVELHPGYLLGRERIVTQHSGSYGWPGETVPATLRIFDADGKLRETRSVTAGPGEARVPVELREGEVAVIERAGG